MRDKPTGGSRRRTHLTIGAASLAALSLTAAACSSNASSNAGSSTGGQGGQASAAASKYPWCGSKQASLALAAGFGDNTWRELTRYSAVTVAAQCPSVTKYTYANGEGNTQKAISDINSLVAEGTTAIVDNAGGGGEGVLFGLVLIDDVENCVTLSLQVVSDQTAMTAPPNSLRTHHGRTLLLCDLK